MAGVTDRERSSIWLPYLPAVQACWLSVEPGRTWRQVEGTLVFADVSGFTPLTERLAALGKVGAEELTDVLNAVFCELLEVAGSLGGDCLKFGGDALLLLFTGDNHADRATAASRAMLAALRPYRRLQTGAGFSRLDMSTGVHSGEIALFLLGNHHRELVLAGPAVTETLTMEAHASAGQVLLSPSTAAQLEGGEVGEQFGPGRLLASQRRPARRAEPFGRRDQAPEVVGDREGIRSGGLDARAGIPDMLVKHLVPGQPGEHRLATVAFIQFGRIDELLAEAGPGALAAAMDELISHVQAVCIDYGVTFVTTDVDQGAGKVYLAAGAPVTASDDEDRLVHALRAILSRPTRLPVRAGANRGRVFTLDLGSANRRNFTLMGDAVNLAARVMGHAPWGELLATDNLVGRLRTHFSLSAVAPFAVKGKSAPVCASLVGSELTEADAGDDGGVPLIGRERELRLLRGALAGAREESGSVVEVIGEPGLGKSRLLAEAVRERHGLQQIAVEAGRYSRATPYYAMRRALRNLVGATADGAPDDVERALQGFVLGLAPDLEPWLPLIGIPLGLELAPTRESARLDPLHRRDKLAALVVDLLNRALTGPTLLTIEDAHWLDDASIHLLSQLLADVESRPWAVIITRRDVAEGIMLSGSSSVTRLRLQPLAESAAESLASAVSGTTTLPRHLIREMAERSGGNPLFLQEMVAAASSGSLTELPDTVEAVLAASIDTLDPGDRRLLRQAAVLGSRFPGSLLPTLVGVSKSTLREQLRRLDHFLGQDSAGLVRFRHVLMRDVAYEGLAFRTRRELHRRAGELIESTAQDPEAVSELLSLHAHQAQQFDESWRYSTIAGARALRSAAPIEAANFYLRALEAARHLPHVPPADVVGAAEMLGDSYLLAGRFPQAVNSYRQARRLERVDGLRRSELHRKEGVVHERAGDFARALRAYGRGFADLAASPSGTEAHRQRARITNSDAIIRLLQGRHARALPLLDRAARDGSLGGDRSVLANTYRLRDWALIELGEAKQDEYRKRALAIYEELGDEIGQSRVLQNMGIASHYLGRWDDSAAAYERSSEAARRAGDSMFAALNMCNIAEVRSDQGHWEEAAALLLEALAIFRGVENRHRTAMAGYYLGRTLSRQGRLDDAAEVLREAAATCREVGASSMLLETEAREVERLVLAAEPVSALSLGESLKSRTERFGGLPYVLTMVERLSGYALCQKGEMRRGKTRIETSLRLSRESAADYETALSLQAMSRVGGELGDPRAEGYRNEAEAIFTALGVVRTPVFPLSSS